MFLSLFHVHWRILQGQHFSHSLSQNQFMLFPIILKSLRNSLEPTNIHYRSRVRNELFIFNIDEKNEMNYWQNFSRGMIQCLIRKNFQAKMHKTKVDSISNPIINFRQFFRCINPASKFTISNIPILNRFNFNRNKNFLNFV